MMRHDLVCLRVGRSMLVVSAGVRHRVAFSLGDGGGDWVRECGGGNVARGVENGEPVEADGIEDARLVAEEQVYGVAVARAHGGHDAARGGVGVGERRGLRQALVHADEALGALGGRLCVDGARVGRRGGRRALSLAIGHAADWGLAKGMRRVRVGGGGGVREGGDVAERGKSEYLCCFHEYIWGFVR